MTNATTVPAQQFMYDMIALPFNFYISGVILEANTAWVAQFDAYILYKSYLVTGRNRIFDWDPIAQASYPYTDVWTNFNFTVADIVCDLMVAVAELKIRLKRKMTFMLAIHVFEEENPSM
ncbi:hypothetical protein HDU98_009400 [Podochytrium sp. JEL0797]|nr:hypothetical protein HDU98_009400 [Podochytrium sp. JEL0797]